MHNTKILVTSLSALLIGFGSVAHACDELCQIEKQTREHGLTPSNVDKICITLKQRKPGVVVIRFYDGNGVELDKNNQAHSNVKGMVDQFCVGRHYLEEARAGHVELCNDVDTVTLRPREIEILLTSGMPANHWVYLAKKEAD
jgi:hypothetical protein